MICPIACHYGVVGLTHSKDKHLRTSGFFLHPKLNINSVTQVSCHPRCIFWPSKFVHLILQHHLFCMLLPLQDRLPGVKMAIWRYLIGPSGAQTRAKQLLESKKKMAIVSNCDPIVINCDQLWSKDIQTLFAPKNSALRKPHGLHLQLMTHLAKASLWISWRSCL